MFIKTAEAQTTTDPVIVQPLFSEGDIVISLFLLLILLVLIMSFSTSLIYGVKVRHTKPF
jgi:hypothetical protein